jgi:biopolymer transport protein ExbB
METKKQKVKKSDGVSAAIVIVLCAIVAFTFFFGWCRNGFGIVNQYDDLGHPANFFSLIYQGGFVVPIILTLLLTVVVLSVERAIALNKAKGNKKLINFVEAVNAKLNNEDLAGARKLCDEQGGSVANILTSALLRYEDIDRKDVSNDEKEELVRKEVEDATTLELPALEQNMNVIATISTLGTLFGLLGTVLGMIRSFSAMGNEGAPDSTALAVGISEALYNTAFGIGTGALAIISYGYFSGKIQSITNAVDEIGFTIGQTFTKRSLKK